MTDEELLGEIEVCLENREPEMWKPAARRLVRRFETRGWLGRAHCEALRELIDFGTVRPADVAALRRAMRRNR